MRQPDGTAFDLVLLLHAACAVVGIVTMVTAAATASRLRRSLEGGGGLPDALRRYFRPGVNWAGRTVYGVPVFGFALLAMSHGVYALDDGWVLGGLALFVGVVLLAEGVVWPVERRLQAALAGPGGASVADEDGSLRRDARLMAGGAAGALALLIAGTVLMVAQP